jgi:hypothetical protein
LQKSKKIVTVTSTPDTCEEDEVVATVLLRADDEVSTAFADFGKTGKGEDFEEKKLNRNINLVLQFHERRFPKKPNTTFPRTMFSRTTFP